MRQVILFNNDWLFEMPGETPVQVNIPHTWNGHDGQDGGDNYKRCKCSYTKTFKKVELKDGEKAILVFDGVNSEAEVFLNDELVGVHAGGYSTFTVDITGKIKDENTLVVTADNSKTEKVYPQTADFTFYGGIYRNVKLLILPKNHFNFMKDSSPCLKIDTKVDGKDGVINVKADVVGSIKPTIVVLDADEKVVATGTTNEDIVINDVHLWNGLKDPYLYKVMGVLKGKEVEDEVSYNIGFRTFRVDPKRGFILNGKEYPLRGVCRHQDRKDLGNALTTKEHDEDIALIKEVGANTIRLAHYQHDQYFYDLCDKEGFVVWAEIPYISRYMKEADNNAFTQMAELIHQNYNHPSIVCWGVSNEITMFKVTNDTRKHHRELNDFCHKEDPSRLTTVACFSVMTIFNRIAHITDLASYNLYWGWYVPITRVTGLVCDMWHLFYPHGPIGLSEYGAEAMTNLHSSHPRRGDNTEEYQAKYHEIMIDSINKRPYLWATHVWNMFDFAADARNQGGEPGMNHKGLVTFDRKIKKDSFYVYKAYWSEEPFIHLCSKRFVNRTGKTTEVKVYTNQKEVSLYQNGKLIETKKGDKIFKFKIRMEKENDIEVVSGNLKDSGKICKVDKKDPSYIMVNGGSSKSWEK